MAVLLETQFEQIIDRFLCPFSRPIEQRKVKRAFGGHSRRDSV